MMVWKRANFRMDEVVADDRQSEVVADEDELEHDYEPVDEDYQGYDVIILPDYDDEEEMGQFDDAPGDLDQDEDHGMAAIEEEEN